LDANSVTAIGLKSFKKAGIKNASIHRLRAAFAIRTIEALLDALDSGVVVGSESSFVETILVKAAEMMGHASPASLRPYLTYVLNRRLQASDAIKSERVASRLRQLRLYEGTMVRRIAHHQGLHLAASLMQSGKNAEAATVLLQLARELNDDGAIDELSRTG
jgi:integrase